jgi:nitrogen-specific signal transduction histidine kinase
MNASTFATLVALIVQLALGFAVLQANWRRKANQAFLLLSLAAAAWLQSLSFAFTAGSPETAEWAIRAASAAGIAILVSLNLLRLSICDRENTWRGLLIHSRGWLVFGLGMIGLCLTNFYLKGAAMPYGLETTISRPIYGGGLAVYGIYFALAVMVLVVQLGRDLRRTSGGVHAELSIVLVSGVLIVAVPLLLGLVLRPFVDLSRLLALAPFRVVLFSIAVGYGIATRRIMEVGFLLRRALSYALLTAYLLGLYTVVWWLSFVAFTRLVGIPGQSFAHVCAAIIVAFAMAPARGISQSFADRLFGGARNLDFRATVSSAAEILKSVSTLPELLERFATNIGKAVGTDRVAILLREKRVFQQANPSEAESATEPMRLSETDPLLIYLSSHQQPVVLDELFRVRWTPDVDAVIAKMHGLNAAVVTGIFSRQHLVGVMVLGPRLSRRIYGSVEQNALQVLCGQLAVAIENAELFTEVQNAKLYNETLLENLTSGVIAVGADESVTVFNNEAGQITDISPRDIIDQPLENLPAPLRQVLRDTLQSVDRQENRDIVLQSGERSVVVRASSSIFHGQEGEMLGALMVLTDITALKRLELQIRRSDRLASLGTLSAGMAHEIKNPLVSIKTFAQLLPERYQDSDFRETFSNLIGHEIDRIDSLVNQLLRFARPAKPVLKPMHVHEVLEKSLLLVGHRLYQKEIKLSRSWNAEVDTIRADADQLEQVFLNFFLNAMDAMKRGGELAVATEIRSADEWIAAVAGPKEEANEILRVTVRDDGEGIKDEDIPHVFDPFFTTKDYGTGLGLSVVHGIIQEHGGQIEVESELSKGTAFHILLPLVRFEAEVAAA